MCHSNLMKVPNQKTLSRVTTEQCNMDVGNYQFSDGTINKLNKIDNDYVNASSVNMFTIKSTHS